MPIPLPNLDDRTFADLVDEARARIPKVCPEWTDHNPTDPGITLIELFGWLAEMALFRIDQVADRHRLAFLRLLNGSVAKDSAEPIDPAALRQATSETMRLVRDRYRAVTPDDFEHLVLNEWPRTIPAADADAKPRVRRVRCLPQRNLALDGKDRLSEAPGHVSVIVVADRGPTERQPGLSPEARIAIWRFLDERRLLTTRHHVVGPDYAKVRLEATLYLKEDVENAADVRGEAAEALRSHFDPLEGGADNAGWPFGQAVYLSEVYAVLDRIGAVDFVRAVNLTAPGRKDREKAEGVTLEAHELVDLDVAKLVTMERSGTSWQPTADQA